MNNIVGYIEQTNFGNSFKKTLQKIFCRIYIERYSFDKYRLLVSTSNIGEKVLNKLLIKLRKNKINTVVLAAELAACRQFFLDNDIQVLNGKELMKNMLKDVVRYIYQNNEEHISNEDLYVAIDNEKNIDVIVDTADLFRSLNIVTKKISKLKRLDNRLENNSNLVYSITSNKKKGLRKAKIIVNFDYDEKFFKDVKLNRNVIIINLSNEQLQLGNIFRGLVVENIDIDYRQNHMEREYFSRFSKSVILESSTYDNSYYKFRECCRMLDCTIKNLVGKNGNICTKEIKNIYLDK